MGFVMVAATLVAWLLVSQAIARDVNALAGRRAPSPASWRTACRRRPMPTAGFRLVVASALGGRRRRAAPLDECVDEAVWQRRPRAGR